jgi:NADPH:quinone reductase
MPDKVPEILPDTMTAIAISSPGGPEALQPTRRAVPVPAADEVLVQVVAAGVNGPDLYQRQGLYPAPPGVTDIPGLEIAGRIVALGDGVESWQVGDVVCALVIGGGYAGYCVAPAVQCLPIPDGMEVIEAAALPETFFTVWTNVFERGRLAQGEILLVHGGSGGIGTTAIQMASRLGARVFTTARGPEKCALCKSIGAEVAIDFGNEDFVAKVKEATGGRGVDVILDIVGGDYVARNIACLAREGRLINIAFRKGSRVEIDLMPVMLKRLTVTGSTLRVQSVERKGEIAAALKERVWPLIADGAIKPLICAKLPLARAGDAHRMMEDSLHLGKIVLTTDAV